MVAGDQHAALAAFCAVRLEGRAQSRDVNPQGLFFAGRIVTPQRVENAIRRHHPVDVDQQKGQ